RSSNLPIVFWAAAEPGVQRRKPSLHRGTPKRRYPDRFASAPSGQNPFGELGSITRLPACLEHVLARLQEQALQRCRETLSLAARWSAVHGIWPWLNENSWRLER